VVLGCLSDGVRADEPIYNAAGGAAIDGYDVVTYFTKDGPKPGDPEVAVMWKGAVWRFVSNENREKFESNPRAFAPQFGGYCAYGVSQGYVVRTDPQMWSIRNGKLYLIHDKSVWSIWQQDVPGTIARANANWPAVLGAK